MDIKQDVAVGPGVKKSRAGRNALLFISALVVSLVLTVLIKAPGFSLSQIYVLFLLFFSIGLWLTEAVPPFAVGLFIMAYLFFAMGHAGINPQPVDPAKYVQTFSNSVIWLLLGGFFLAEAMTKTGIDVYLFKFALKLSGRTQGSILLGTMTMTMVASMILSNSATTSMVLASVMPLIRRLEKSEFSTALIIGIPIAAAIGGMGTIIGSPTNAIAVGALENDGLTLDFSRWLSFGIPLSVVFTLVSWWMLKIKYIRASLPVDLEFVSVSQAEDKKSGLQRKIVVAVVIVSVALWMTSPIHHLSVAAVSVVPLIFLTMTGILKPEDVRKIPWDTLLLVAGGLSLGLALRDTKLLEHFAGHIMGMNLETFALFLVFAYVTMLFSNIMSNTATASILIPLATYLIPEHKEQIAVIIGLSASTALLLPVSTPPNAIAYSTGLIQQKDFLPGGLLIGLLGPLVIVLTVLLLL
jgi:sodium-dependent dicarboxylate transporter 2/3/5